MCVEVGGWECYRGEKHTLQDRKSFPVRKSWSTSLPPSPPPQRPSRLWPSDKCLELGHSGPLWWENVLNGPLGLWGRALVQGLKSLFWIKNVFTAGGSWITRDVLITPIGANVFEISLSKEISVLVSVSQFHFCILQSSACRNSRQRLCLVFLYFKIFFFKRTILLIFNAISANMHIWYLICRTTFTQYWPTFPPYFLVALMRERPWENVCVSKGYAISPPRWDSTDL